MTTRCKVICVSTGEVQAGYGSQKVHYSARLTAVYSISAENSDFFAATPSATFELTTLKQPFQVGKEYYVDFIEIDE